MFKFRLNIQIVKAFLFIFLFLLVTSCKEKITERNKNEIKSAASSLEFEKTITLSITNMCPYICYSKDKPNISPTGFLVDIINNIFKKKGYQVNLVRNPFKRGVHLVRDYEKQHVDGIVGIMLRNAPDLVYPEAEIGTFHYHFYAKPESKWWFNGLASLLNSTIGVNSGHSYGVLDSYIKRNKKSNILLIYGDSNIVDKKIKLLNNKRIDSFLEDKSVVNYKLKNKKTSIVVAGSIPPDNIYVGFSPNNKKSKNYASMVSRGIKRLRKSGELSEILQEYGLKDWKNSKPISENNIDNHDVQHKIIKNPNPRLKKIRFVGSTAKETSGYWKYAKKFKEIIESRSKGRLTVELVFGGISEQDIVMDLADGKTEMGMVATNNLTPFAPSLEFMTFPYLFPSTDSMKKIIRHSYMKKISERSTRESLVRPISWYIGGFRFLANNKKPVEATSDLKGLKIRVPRNQLMVEAFRSWGIETYPLPWPDVYPALEAGLIHGQENPLNIIFSGINTSRPIWESLKYITRIHYFVFTAPHMVSEVYLQSLSADDRKLILDAAKASQEYIWKLVLTNENELVKFAKSKGMKIIDPLDEENDWKSKAVKIWPKFYQQIGGEKVIDRIQEIIK